MSAIFELLLEITIGVTGFLVLRVFGKRTEGPAETLCMLVGLATWAGVAGLVVLVAWLAGFLT